MIREEVVAFLHWLQDSICSGLEEEDGTSRFVEDQWNHSGGGGGRSRVMTHGNVFEKGGVNFSAVEGQLPDFIKGRVNPEAKSFFATGVSLVIHPFNPMVPIVHMNVRYFETDKGDSWFGGGIDLTPIYIDEEQARYFHSVLKEVCDGHDASWYEQFRDWADRYFYIPHRQETRGIGGIFYDYLQPGEKSAEELFQFMQDVGNAFLKAYRPIVNANKGLSFTEENKEWQMLRRGRYVEFNLVYDRGTKFGLETGGRTESILMSLPERAGWVYNFQPKENSPEQKTQSLLRQGVRWG